MTLADSEARLPTGRGPGYSGLKAKGGGGGGCQRYNFHCTKCWRRAREGLNFSHDRNTLNRTRMWDQVGSVLSCWHITTTILDHRGWITKSIKPPAASQHCAAAPRRRSVRNAAVCLSVNEWLPCLSRMSPAIFQLGLLSVCLWGSTSS